jgi:four helix bundle protein
MTIYSEKRKEVKGKGGIKRFNCYYMLELSHKKLDVYLLAMELVKDIYQITKLLPKDEQYILVNQIRRAAVSVCSNIAEGSARRSKAEKLRFYEISRSSIVEIDTQLEIALILNYFKENEMMNLERKLKSVFNMLSKMITNLQPPLVSRS